MTTRSPLAPWIRFSIFVATLAFIGAGTYLMVRYAQGYRPTKAGTIKGTGLLAANSYPTGAEVYINDKLTTATDNTLNLDPGEYQVTIKKDGYHTWSKNLTLTAELVTSTNAQLFPSSPTLEPLSYSGALHVVPAPDGTKLAFAVASSSASTKNGLYIQDLTSSPLSLNKNARQISRTESSFDYTNCTFTWSPNGSELLVAFPTGAHVLLDATRFTDSAALRDVTFRLPQIFSEWELELAREEQTRLLTLPDELAKIASTSATNLYFAPDGERLLYQATSSFTLPDNLVPPIPSRSTQPESRTTQPGSWYVYDLKEDKNFFLAEGTLPSPTPSVSPKTKKSPALPPTFVATKLLLLSDFAAKIPAELVSSPSAYRTLQTGYSVPQTLTLFNAQYSSLFASSLQWYPDSSHLIITRPDGIDIVEYDGTNRVTLYAGPMDPSFIYPWPDGSKLITRIQFSPDTIPNLYTIKLK